MVGRYKPLGQRNVHVRPQAVMWHEVQDVSDIDPFEDAIKEHRKDAGRSREEIERLTVDGDLSDLERACLFLSPNAHSLQQACALSKLQPLFKEYGVAAYESFFPTFTTSIENFSPHNQVVAAEAFTSILRDGSTSKEAPNWFLPLVIHMVKNPRSQEVMHAWLGTLQAMVPLLPQQVLTEDLLQLALAKGQGEESVQAHTVCCTIFGAIAPMLEGKLIVQTYLHKAMALCQDTDAEVRMCMCEQLNAISRAVGFETFMVFVFPELNELLKDEEAVVQNAAIDGLVHLLDFLPPDIRKSQVLPFLRSLCDEANGTVLICLARQFGDIIMKMLPDLSEEELQLLVDAYKVLVQQASEEVRQLCAYNFPAVLKTVGARKYSLILHATYLQLVQDSSSSVRSTIAASFHEVSKILGRERTASYLKDAFLHLLKDPTYMVQAKLFENLQQVLGHFSVNNTQSKTAMYTAIIPSLLHAEKGISCTNQWRLQRAFLQSFPQFPEHLTSDQIHDNFVPICFRYMADGVLPVKCAAALALAVFIRNNCKALQRYEISQKVVKEYGQGKSYWSRLLYIDFCESLLRVASSRMFKESFLEPAISALQDPVPSIRMRACQIVNHLRTVIKLPDDVAALERINHLATQRLNDSDREVVAAARLASDNQKRVFIHDRESTNDHPSAQDEYEKMDKLREDEEWNMLSKEEQEEKRKLDESILRLKIENLRKTSADIGRNVSTSTSESSSSHRVSKSLNRSATGGRLSIDQGRSSRGSIMKVKTPIGSQNPAAGSTNNGVGLGGSPGSTPSNAAQIPCPSGTSQPPSSAGKRGSVHIPKPRPPSPGPPMKSQGVPSASPANPLSDSTSGPTAQPARRNSFKPHPILKKSPSSG